MNKHKTVIYFILPCFFILIGSLSFWKYKEYKKANQNNILIISFCSVNINQLPVFGHGDGQKYPALNAIFNNSYNLINTFTSANWSNVRRYLYYNDRMKNKAAKVGNADIVYYPALEEWNSPKNKVAITSFRIPKEVEATNFENFSSDLRLEDAYKDMGSHQAKILDKIKSNDKNLIILHYKFMHYPYLPNMIMNDKIKMNQSFTKEELDLIKEYTTHPQKYPEKYTFFQATFPLLNFPNIYKNSEGKNVTYVTEPSSLLKWQHSKNYLQDVSIMIKSYQLKLQLLDSLIFKWSKFYREQLESQNTVLVLSGDHGESLTENNVITHNTLPYDITLHYFLSIHYPFQNKSEKLTKQLSQRTSSHVFESILNRNLDESGFRNLVVSQLPDNEILVSSNCTGDYLSARQSNKWKLIYSVKTEELQLFDVSSDPLELKNVANENPQIIGPLKLAILKRLESLIITPGRCVY